MKEKTIADARQEMIETIRNSTNESDIKKSISEFQALASANDFFRMCLLGKAQGLLERFEKDPAMRMLRLLVEVVGLDGLDKAVKEMISDNQIEKGTSFEKILSNLN